MHRKLLSLFLLLFFGNVFVCTVFSQKSSPTGLAVEITSYSGRPPAYQAVADSEAKAGWSWTPLFRRVPDFQIPAGSLPIRAVKTVSYLEGEKVKIIISVLRGEKTFDKEETVAKYSVRENERITIKELANFGVVPFEIAIVRVAPSVAVLPSIVNKTNSIQVTSTEPNFSTLPSYKIKFLNTSAKAVSALTTEVMVNGQVRISGMPQGKKGMPLMEPGATFELVMNSPLEFKQPVNGEVPPAQTNQEFVISSVIFEDGTYEGDTIKAARFHAYALGRKVQLKRIIALLQKTIENTTQLPDLDKLDKQIEGLGKEIDNESFIMLTNNFPSLTEKEKILLRSAVESPLSSIKFDTRKELNDFRNSNSNANADAIRVKLSEIKEQYQNWLMHLP